MRVVLQNPINLSSIKRMFNARSSKEDENVFINAISIDTRELQKNDLFIPMKGERFDGEQFLNDSISIGAYALSAKQSGKGVIRVENTAKALLEIAKAYKSTLNIKKCIAITGSVGKTTTKELCVDILSRKYNVCGTYKNFNNEIGVPFTVLSASQKTEVLVIEAGMNHSGELAAISNCINPEICVITKIGNAHVGNLGSRKNIAEAKKEILRGGENPTVIVPYDEPLLYNIKNRKTFSLNSANADFDFSLSDTEKRLYTFRHKHGLIKDLIIKNNHAHIPECLGFAISACIEAGMDDYEIKGAVNELEKMGNINTVKIGDITVIDDSYNSSPEATEYAFKTLLAYPAKRRCALIGDMLELGDESHVLHYRIGTLAADSKIDALYLFGHYSDCVKEGAIHHGISPNSIFVNKNTSDFFATAEQIVRNSRDGDVILFKASHKLELRKIIEILKNKYV